MLAIFRPIFFISVLPTFFLLITACQFFSHFFFVPTSPLPCVTRSWTLGERGRGIFLKCLIFLCRAYLVTLFSTLNLPFPFGCSLTFCALGPVVKLRLVVLRCCDDYKELIYVHSYLLKLQVFVQETDHDVKLSKYRKKIIWKNYVGIKMGTQ